MYYKLIDDYTIQSSVTVNKTPEGRPVSNFTAWLRAKPEEYRISLGWYELLEEPFPGSEDISGNISEISDFQHVEESNNYRLRYSLSENNVIHGVWEEYVVETPPFNMLRTTLRQNMTEAGLGEVLDAYLASNDKAKLLWDECIVLESNSEFIINAVQTIAAMGLKTEAELQEILEKSRTNLVV